MELKRFVLLSYNTIVDVSKETYYLKGENELYRDRPNAVLVTVRIGIIKKTSDNILDLVEVGDLVMSDDYVGALKVLSNTRYYFRTYHATVTKKNVRAIFKRQPNGDYKRYEVV